MNLIYTISFLLTLILFQNNFLSGFPEINELLKYFLLIQYIIIPGHIILTLFKRESKSYLSLKVGISIIFFYFFSLLLNTFLPSININNPLDYRYASLFINSIIIVFLIIVQLKNRNNNLKNLEFKKINYLNTFIFIISILLPISSVFGAIKLNNFSDNALVLINYSIIPILIIINFFNRNRNDFLNKFLLFSISLTLLFSYSFRGNYANGYDIQLEKYVFNLAYQNSYWNFSLYKDPYNACLSITTLPTILMNLTNIGTELFFKFFYPLIISIAITACYKIFKKITNDTNAFIGTLLIIFQPQYIIEITMLSRQTIGFLFFILLVFNIFIERKSKINNSITILLCIGLVLSHYSTTYITIIVLALTYTLTFAYNLFIKVTPLIKKEFILPSIEKKLNLITILFLSTSTILWYSQITTGLSGIFNVGFKTIQTLNKSVENDLKSESAKATIWNSKNGPNQEDINRYVENKSNELKNVVYDENVMIDNSYIPLIVIPKNVKYRFNFNQRYLNFFFQGISFSIKMMLILGLLTLVLSKLIKKEKIEQIIIIKFIFISIIVGFIALPYISTAYNIERLNLQALFLVGLLFPLGFSFINSNIKKYLRLNFYFMLPIILIAYFVYSTGFIWQIIGGQAGLQFNNYGEYYKRFYIQKSEAVSVEWLNENRYYKNFVFADRYGHLLFTGKRELNYKILLGIFPGIIDKYSYVYASHANFSEGTVSVEHNQKELNYVFPKDFLDLNKNLIYSNFQSAIYK